MKKLKVLLVEPMKKPVEATVGSSLEAMQEAVDGPIEAVYPFDDDVGIVCNEEGKIRGLPLNRSLKNDDGGIYDIVAGRFFIVGLTRSGNFRSITDEEMNKFSEVFKTPEEFVKIDGRLYALPVSD